MGKIKHLKILVYRLIADTALTVCSQIEICLQIHYALNFVIRIVCFCFEKIYIIL